MLKISTKLTLWYLTATGLTIFIMAAAVYIIYENQRRQAIDDDLKDYSEFLTSGLGDQSSDLNEIFNQMLEKKNKPPKVPRANRLILASNDSIFFESIPSVNVDSLIKILEDKHEFSFKSTFNTIKFHNTEYRTYSVPLNLKANIKDKKKQMLYKDLKLIVVISLDKLYESLSQLVNILLLLSPFSLLFSGLIGFFIARRALAPVRDITLTAAEISSQSLEKRVPVGKTDDELTVLATTFNEMIDRLDNTFKSQQRFIADASHDLRTPLTVIQMELELLKKEYNNAVENENSLNGVDETIDRCLREIYRLNQLAGDLMILARADAKQLTLNKNIIRIDELVIECMEQLNNVAKSKNIQFLFNVDVIVEVQGDEVMLRRAIMNIIDNALKYSPQNATVYITIIQNDGYASIICNNSGIIQHDDLSKIFDRFSRGEKSRTSDGFGLGLAIVKTIIDAHGGKVLAESDHNKGTTFQIQIPV